METRSPVQLIQSLPDTQGTRLAHEKLLNTQNQMIINHSLRVYLLAIEYARLKQIKYDLEALSIACLVHDVGLFDIPRADKAQPFTWRSAAHVTARDLQISLSQEKTARTAIELHMNFRPKWRYGNEAGLLQVGAWMDVAFLRFWNIPAEYRKFISEKYPKLGMEWKFLPILLRNINSIKGLRNLFRVNSDFQQSESVP